MNMRVNRNTDIVQFWLRAVSLSQTVCHLPSVMCIPASSAASDHIARQARQDGTVYVVYLCQAV